MRIISIISFLLCCSIYVNARTPVYGNVKEDSTASSYLKNIKRWSNSTKYALEESDSLLGFNKQLTGYLKNALTQVPIEGKLYQAESYGLMSTTSEDNKLHLYTWDTWAGNTMHYFNTLAQYRTDGTTKVRVLNDITDTTKSAELGSYATEISSIQIKDGKTVYLVMDYTIASKNEKGNGVRAFVIENGELKNHPLFKTQKLVTNYIDFVYNVTYDSLTSFIIQIHLSPDKKKLYIPVILKTGRLAKEYWVYAFNGDKYVYKKRIKAK